MQCGASGFFICEERFGRDDAVADAVAGRDGVTAEGDDAELEEWGKIQKAVCGSACWVMDTGRVAASRRRRYLGACKAAVSLESWGAGSLEDKNFDVLMGGGLGDVADSSWRVRYEFHKGGFGLERSRHGGLSGEDES